jgi:hypothetical protein
VGGSVNDDTACSVDDPVDVSVDKPDPRVRRPRPCRDNPVEEIGDYVVLPPPTWTNTIPRLWTETFWVRFVARERYRRLP